MYSCSKEQSIYFFKLNNSRLRKLSFQMKVVTDGVEIIIATPGRLNDLIDAGCVKVESVSLLVLDEVSL